MTLLQDIFNLSITHMRLQGNPWKSTGKRKWAYINPENHSERCVKGIFMDVMLNTSGIGLKYKTNTTRLYELYRMEYHIHPMLNDLESVFEHADINDWEDHFKTIADNYNLYLEKIKEESKESQKQEKNLEEEIT